VDKSDKLASFSSRGPRLGDGAVKPDVTAPGVAITAARSKDGTLVGGKTGDKYVTLSGTSMATPHTAGAVALLAQQHPDWTPGRIKAALMGSAKPAPGLDAFAQGAGRIDVAKAITQTVTADPASVNFGQQLWPHADDEVLTRDVTYHNAGTAPITLALTVDGGSAPAGTFAVSPASITVPAGGDATATVTADTRVAGPDGVFAGALIASGDGQSTRTPFAVDKEVESYDLTLDYIDRDDFPSDEVFTSLANWDGSGGQDIGRSGGPVTVRIKKGRYALTTWFFAFGSEGDPKITMLTQPVLDMSGDRTVTMDARLGKANKVTVPQPSAIPVEAGVNFTMRTTGGYGMQEGGVGMGGGGFDQIYTAQIGDTTPIDGYTSELVGTWAEAGPDGTTRNSPYTYSTTHYLEGRMFSGYQRTVTAAELAAVTVRHLSGGDGTSGGWYAISRQPGQERFSWATIVEYDTPATVTHYYTTEGEVQWHSVMEDFTEDGPIAMRSTPYTHYEPGAYAQTWNQAVFGPVLAAPVHGMLNKWVGVVRDGDTISVDLPLYNDAAGNIDFGGDSGSTTLYRDGVTVGQEQWGGERVHRAGDRHRAGRVGADTDRRSVLQRRR
jgi:hypothetical protein